MGSHRHRRVERDGPAEWRGMAPAPQTGEGWSRPSTAERRGMETSRYRRAERDGIAPALQSGEGLDRTDTAEWRGMAPAPQT